MPTLDVEFQTITCSCGGVYALTKVYVENKREVGECWACPYCRRGWGFDGSGENAKLKRKLERAKTDIDYWRKDRDAVAAERDHANRCVAAERGAKTKLKKRAAAGLCPCCNRTLQNLARHMSGQHPGFAE